MFEFAHATCLVTSFRDLEFESRSKSKRKRKGLAERIGIEPTSVPVRGTDNGFEDREDHQAPVTLRIGDCEKIILLF